MRERKPELSMAAFHWAAFSGLWKLLGGLLVGYGAITTSIASATPGVDPMSGAFAPGYFSRDSFGLDAAASDIVRGLLIVVLDPLRHLATHHRERA